MIARYVLHLEAHRGRRPRVSLRRAPRAGQVVVDGGILGTLEPCPECGDGFLHRPDEPLSDIDRMRYVLARAMNLPARLFGLPQVPRELYTRPRPAPLPDQGGCAVPSPAGKNDQATTRAPLPPRPDDAAEAAAREYFGSAYAEAAGHGDPVTAGALVAFRGGWERATAALEAEVRAIRREAQGALAEVRAQRDEARDLAEGLQAEVDALRRATGAVAGSRLTASRTDGTDPVPAPGPVRDALRAHPLHRVLVDVLRWGTTDRAQRHGAPTDHLWATAYGGARTWHADPDQLADDLLAAIAATSAGPATREAWARLRSCLILDAAGRAIATGDTDGYVDALRASDEEPR